MAASDLATVIYSYVFVTGAIGSVLWFVAKKAIHHVIEENLHDLKVIKAEVTPNHGSSMNDVVKLQLLPLVQDLRKDQLEISSCVAKLEGKFEQHINEHSRA
jgi:hypothetical protein